MSKVKILNSKDINTNKKSELSKHLMNSEYLDIPYDTNNINSNNKNSTDKKKSTDKKLNGNENIEKIGMSLTESLRSSIKSTNKDKLDWIITQNITIENSIKSLNANEIEYLIDFLTDKLLNQKTKPFALIWLEEILKTCNKIISIKKLSDIKIAIKSHTLNYNIIMETLSRFQILEEIKNKNSDKANKQSANNNAVKLKPSLIYNESDSENENELKKKEEASKKKIKEKVKDKKDKFKVKMNSKKKLNKMDISDDDEDKELDESINDSIYDDDDIMNQANLEDMADEEDEEFEEDD